MWHEGQIVLTDADLCQNKDARCKQQCHTIAAPHTSRRREVSSQNKPFFAYMRLSGNKGWLPMG